MNYSQASTMHDDTRTTATVPAVQSVTSMWQFYVGLGLALSSSIFIGTSFIIKKKALIRLSTSGLGTRAGAGGFGYLRDWMWWLGVILMGIGEACNFTAYAFAPASLVTPLGALSVLVTAILSSKFLREKLNLLGKIGCAICILGSTVIVLHAPKEENVSSMAELSEKMQKITFLAYVVFVLCTSMYLAWIIAPRYGTQNILVFIAICSLIGSLSVLGCKGFGLAIKETIEGRNQLTNFLTWFWLISIVLCVSVQLNYLNKALDVYNTAMVTPIYYVCFTSLVILATGIVYEEWGKLGFTDITGNVVGFLITVIGIFQMQLFKDYNVTWRQLRQMMWRNQNGVAPTLSGPPSSDTRSSSNNSPIDRGVLDDHPHDAIDADGTGHNGAGDVMDSMHSERVLLIDHHRSSTGPNTPKPIQTRMYDATTRWSVDNHPNHATQSNHMVNGGMHRAPAEVAWNSNSNW